MIVQEVHQDVGLHARNEQLYRDYLFWKLRATGLNVDKEVNIPVVYKGNEVSHRRADMVLETAYGEKAVIEVKNVVKFEPKHLGQVQYYMNAFGIAQGYLVNFPRPDRRCFSTRGSFVRRLNVRTMGRQSFANNNLSPQAIAATRRSYMETSNSSIRRYAALLYVRVRKYLRDDTKPVIVLPSTRDTVAKITDTASLSQHLLAITSALYHTIGSRQTPRIYRECLAIELREAGVKTVEVLTEPTFQLPSPHQAGSLHLVFPSGDTALVEVKTENDFKPRCCHLPNEYKSTFFVHIPIDEGMPDVDLEEQARFNHLLGKQFTVETLNPNKQSESDKRSCSVFVSTFQTLNYAPLATKWRVNVKSQPAWRTAMRKNDAGREVM